MKRSNPGFTFFVYDWNPNGTNDLAVVNDIGEVVDGISEALFGVDVNKLKTEETYLDPYDNPSYEIPAKLVSRYIACSPLDPHGKSVLRQLRKYGIE